MRLWQWRRRRRPLVLVLVLFCFCCCCSLVSELCGSRRLLQHRCRTSITSMKSSHTSHVTRASLPSIIISHRSIFPWCRRGDRTKHSRYPQWATRDRLTRANLRFLGFRCFFLTVDYGSPGVSSGYHVFMVVKLVTEFSSGSYYGNFLISPLICRESNTNRRRLKGRESCLVCVS